MRITVIRKDGVKKRRAVKVGSPFAETMYQRASYDKVYWFKVLLTGEEVLPEGCPEKIEAGMDILLIHEDIKYEPTADH